MPTNKSYLESVERTALRIARESGLTFRNLSRLAPMSERSARRWIKRLAAQGKVAHYGEEIHSDSPGRNMKVWRITQYGMTLNRKYK